MWLKKKNSIMFFFFINKISTINTTNKNKAK